MKGKGKRQERPFHVCVFGGEVWTVNKCLYFWSLGCSRKEPMKQVGENKEHQSGPAASHPKRNGKSKATFDARACVHFYPRFFSCSFSAKCTQSKCTTHEDTCNRNGREEGNKETERTNCAQGEKDGILI